MPFTYNPLSSDIHAPLKLQVFSMYVLTCQNIHALYRLTCIFFLPTWENHRKTTNRTDTQSNIVSIPGTDKTYQHCNNQGVPPKMQVHFNKCLPPRMQGPFLVC